MRDLRHLGLWYATLLHPIEPRAPLERDARADVAIVGAGYTGLWTAYYLTRLEPGIRVAIVEAEFAGFGASGRNGGWCLGSMAGLDSLAADPAHREGALRLQRALFDAVDEVGRVCAREAIECHYAKGGWISVASVAAQRERLRADLAGWHAQGLTEEDARWLEPAECAARVRTPRNLGGLFFAHCAALHPARLARGLALAVERRGVVIHERSPALAIEGRSVVTRRARLRADTVVRATEGFSGSLRGEARRLVPMHSMMVATEPLSEDVWKEIGLERREAFSDARRIVVYGQRTADGRLAFGSRGRYLFGSAVPERFADDSRDYARVERILASFFPTLRGCRIEHRWSGPVAVPRGWRPSVGLDRATGLAWAGGYVGEGVAASNLAGRTLAELILGRESERTSLPLVGAPFPLWEPEPLRWLGVQGVLRLGQWLDASELAGRRPSRLAGAVFRRFVRA
ncbi:MAG TPA: FAD-dependent oxidoreductase [Myxococcota bacterium]|nr:FAD-dependent oxidoreductase [Myxococcota bacterium]